MTQRHLFRICNENQADELSGWSLLGTEGRWHSGSRPLLYSFSSEALAKLEALVHAGAHQSPLRRVLVVYALPSSLSCRSLSAAELPPGWDGRPAPVSCRELGDRWLASAESLLLMLPSAMTPNGDDRVVLINPLHPDSAQITVQRRVTLGFDEVFPR